MSDMKPEKKNYIDRKKLNQLILNDLQNNKISEELKLIIFQFSNNILTKNNYRDYPDYMKEEIKCMSFQAFTKYWKGFNIEKGDAYSYITSTVMNTCSFVIKKYKTKEFGKYFSFEESKFDLFGMIDETIQFNEVDWQEFVYNDELYYDYSSLHLQILGNLNKSNVDKESIITLVNRLDENSNIKKILLKDKTFQKFLKLIDN